MTKESFVKYRRQQLQKRVLRTIKGSWGRQKVLHGLIPDRETLCFRCLHIIFKGSLIETVKGCREQID